MTMTIRFNAAFYNTAMLCASTEETRYYLIGVNVEPHPTRGVILTATDGHVLLSIHDVNGYADTTAIVHLSPEAAKSCKVQKNDLRDIEIDGTTARIVEIVRDGDSREVIRTVAISEKCLVDGTFPAWRRVVPSLPTEHTGYAPFSATICTTLAKVAIELAGTKGTPTHPTTFCVVSGDKKSPAITLFPASNHAFAVVMPKGSSDEAPAMPDWFVAVAPKQAVAA